MKRAQLVCLREGKQDIVFVNAFIKAYDPSWLRPHKSGNVYFEKCNGKTELLQKFPQVLLNCAKRGADTALIVLADVDDDCDSCEELKKKYIKAAKDYGIDDGLLKSVVFVFPKDRIENWIQFINDGVTDEAIEAPRVKNEVAVAAARKLADMCKTNIDDGQFPTSLKWSCKNWRRFVGRMRK